jgi:OFA family oxalate/formate antiporter-like MFS transporter
MMQRARDNPHGPRYRWLQLLPCIVSLAMVANLQYGWTLFVNPLDARFGWGRAAIQLAFTIFILAETWLMPFAGYLADRCGPRRVTMAGGVLVGIAWVMNAYADSLSTLYISAALGGAGAAAVYGACIGAALKGFPDQRGLAAGLTAAGFGTLAALTLLPIQAMIKSSGFEAAFLYFGIGQGLIVCLAALGIASPPAESIKPTARRALAVGRNYRPLQVLQTPVFWIMYLIFVLMAAGGLMATAHFASLAKDFRIADAPVSILGLALPALTFALAIDRVFSGLSRPFFGWLSDRIGREHTMFIAFGIEAGCILALARFGGDPVMFVLLAALAFFAWGEIYSLFPAACADSFGAQYAAANAGLLYTAKGTASLLVPVSGMLTDATGGWHAAFYVAAGMNAVAAVAAVAVLKPLRARQLAADRAGESPLGVKAAK